MEIKQSSLVALGIVAAALTVAYAFSNKSRKQSKPVRRDEEEDDIEIISEEKGQLERSRELLINLSSNVNIEWKEEGVLTKKSLLEFIVQALQSVTSKEVMEFYISNRKARRACKKQLTAMTDEKYFKYACYFDNDIEYMISKSHKDLAAFVNIDERIIDQSIDYHLTTDPSFESDLMTITVQLRKAIKNKLAPTNSVTIQTTKQIIQRQIQILTNDSSKITDIIENLGISQQDQIFVPSFIDIYLKDTIYQQFHVQQQDYSAHEQQLIGSEDGRQLFRKLQQAQNKLIRRVQGLTDSSTRF